MLEISSKPLWGCIGIMVIFLLISFLLGLFIPFFASVAQILLWVVLIALIAGIFLSKYID